MAVSNSKTVGNGKDMTLGIHVPFSPLRYFAMHAIPEIAVLIAINQAGLVTGIWE